MTRTALSRTVSLLFAVLVLGTACAGGSDSASEIAAVQADSAAAVSAAEDRAEAAEAAAQDSSDALGAAQETIEEQEVSIEQLTQDLTQARTDVTADEARITTLRDELEDARTATTIAKRLQSEADEEIAELRAKYDTELRADAQIAWDTELAEACAEAGDGTGSIIRFVSYNDELAVIGTKTELVALVTTCAEPLRERSEVDRLNARCERGSVDQVTKGPDELAGNCYVIFVVPWQWDSRTGLCNFLGSWDSSNEGTRSFNYDGDGLFRAIPTVCSDQLEDADQDDLLQVWVELNGSYAYDTAAGGTNEIPEFTILRAVLIAKA